MVVMSSEMNVLDFHTGFLTMPDEKDNNLFFGVELECINIDCNYQALSGKIKYYRNMLAVEKAIADVAILKPDASFEIVTVPATLRYHKEQLWNKFFDTAAKYCRGDSGYGLHIHFSREALTPLQLAKVICFYHETCNSMFLTNLAGRTVASNVPYCSTMNVKHTIEGATEITSNKSAAIHISSRNASKTAEVRIFQSNPTKQGVFQALELVDAVIKYCKNHGKLSEALQYKGFLDWFVEENKKEEYPYLHANLINHGYLKEVKKIDMVA